MILLARNHTQTTDGVKRHLYKHTMATSMNLAMTSALCCGMVRLRTMHWIH